MSWTRDPLVWLGAAFGAGATAYALFAGRYVPYIDWSNHIGLISVLAHGGETGALAYMDRSLAPTPYLLFYGLTALVGQLVPVDVAAKVVIALAGGAFTLGAASLADATGRSPRLGLIAPLAVFSISMGWGFASFVFATPILFFMLAGAERLLLEPSKRRFLLLAAWICVGYLAHALIYLTFPVVMAPRLLALIAARRREGPQGGAQRACERRPLPGPVRRSALVVGAVLPSLALVIPGLIGHIETGGQEAGTASTQILYFVPWQEHVQQIGGHLLERGSPAHWSVMWWTVALGGAWALLSLVRPKRGGSIGLEIYATALLFLFLFGPNSIEWPSSIWMTYPRFGVIAAAAILLVPRVELGGLLGGVLAAPALALVAWNASLNAGHIKGFSEWARQYDPVREAIPKRARVLPLTVVDGNDMTTYHPALGSLYFYHLVDGAAYVPFLFDLPALPVRQKVSPKPRAPFWRNPGSYDPRTHGADYDYLVLRGAGIVERTVQAGLHERVADINGWTVFKTKQPPPWP